MNLLYYIINYVIKNNIFSFHILMKTALLKQQFDQNSRRNFFDDSNNEKRKESIKFALQCFNKLSQNRKINDVQTVNFLLNHSFHYINIKDFTFVNLWNVRQHIRELCQNTIFDTQINQSFNDLSKESFFLNDSCRL